MHQSTTSLITDVLGAALGASGPGPWCESHVVLLTRLVLDESESPYVFTDVYRVTLVSHQYGPDALYDSHSLTVVCRWGAGCVDWTVS